MQFARPCSNQEKILTGDLCIDGVNLESVIYKACCDIEEEGGLGWDKDFASEIAQLYKTFLFLNKKYPEEILVPTREIDEFWHLHILFTKKYHEDCQNIFGYYLHHQPQMPEGEIDEEQALERTLQLVKLEFPHLY